MAGQGRNLPGLSGRRGSVMAQSNKVAIVEGATLDCRVGDQTVRLFCARLGYAYHVSLHKPGPIAGYGGSDELLKSFQNEAEARAYARNLVVGLREIDNLVGGETPAKPTIRLFSAAKGTQTKISESQKRILTAAVRSGGYIRRKRDSCGEATVTQLTALARRGYIDLDVRMDGRRKIVVGGDITPAGYTALNGDH